MSETVGFIGLGQMGLPMAINLLQDGRLSRVYNRTASKAEPLVARGAKRAAGPADAAEPGQIVITLLSNDQALEEVALQGDQLAKRLGRGGIHLSMSTISPATSRKLAEHHAKFGALYVAAPIFGRPDAVAARKMWVILSGPAAALERVRPVLQPLAQALFEAGEDPGAANVVKLAGNFMIGAAIEAMGEAFALAEKNGVPRTRVEEIFTASFFACPVFRNYGKKVAEESYQPAGFKLALGLKDMNLVQQTAVASATPMPLAGLLRDRLLSAVAKGRAEWDWAALALGATEDAGVRR